MATGIPRLAMALPPLAMTHRSTTWHRAVACEVDGCMTRDAGDWRNAHLRLGLMHSRVAASEGSLGLVPAREMCYKLSS
eukprot:2562551-Prymnesium_polylepis.1